MFDEVVKKLDKYELVRDGEIVETQIGKVVNFLGPEGEHLSINNFILEGNQILDKS